MQSGGMHLNIGMQSIHQRRLFDRMQGNGSMDLLAFQFAGESSLATGIVAQNVLHLIVPGAGNPGKLLDTATHLHILVGAIEILQAGGNMWSHFKYKFEFL